MNIMSMVTILIVEDALSELELISTYLKESGYVAIGAVTGQEGLNLAIEKKPDVILSDVVMPGMSGFELCRKLKQNPATEKIPIILCTSKNQEIDRLWGMKQGADAYITKPFTREQLIRAVKCVVR
ncbi:PleD family two-component system response regulator [Microseira sp. BLCC-F43]|uniref:response regulator n=1 Tax=Microseira sp. BLCC-F43 TaxID=3153602 RepID=UPI0035B908BE